MFLGFSLTVIFVGRLIWAFIGSKYALFSNFITSPLNALRYMRDIARGKPAHYLGHNPAGGWMVLALLLTVGVLLVTGLALQATLEFEGPLVEPLSGLTDADVQTMRDFHDIALNVLYLLVPLHLLGVVLASRQHKENLVRAMITGFKSTQTNHRTES